MCDLDGNGTLNREEFNLYNLRTSGEEVADDEWEVVEGKPWLRCCKSVMYYLRM